MRALLLAIAALVAIGLLAPRADAHGMRTAFVDVTEVSPGHALVRVRTSVADSALSVHADAPCAIRSAPSDGDGDAGLELACPTSLDDAAIEVRGLGALHTEAIVAVERASGARVTHLVTIGEPRFVVPGASPAAEIAKSYVALGVKHIASGADHLLFLLALVLLLRSPRAVIAAETAFTASHSLSFTATALGWVRVSSQAAEACIALSLVLVALDIGKSKPSARHGAAMAFLFGLVHGLGFAGGLREIGLPDHDVSVALVGFAAGVEIGQVAFLALALGAVALLARRVAFDRIASIGARVTGSIACFWLFDRLAVIVASRFGI